MSKSQLGLRAFLLQALVSSAPGVLFTANIPLFASYIEVSLAGLGLMFLYYRIGLLISSLFSSRVTYLFGPRLVAATSEILNAGLAIVLLWSYFKGDLYTFQVTLFFKGLFAGFILIVRFHWIRSLAEGRIAEQVFTATNLVSQVTYGLSGILIVLDVFEPSNVYVLAIIDFVTSLLGAYIFFQTERVRRLVKNPSRQIISLRLLVRGSRKWLSGAELSMACSLGGTNLLLVEYGQKYFYDIGGYGTSLFVYSLLYGVGGTIVMRRSIGSRRPNRGAMVASILVISASFLVLGVVENLALSLAAFATLFTGYGFVYCTFDAKWMSLVKPEEAALVAGSRSLVIGLIWAFGEWGYALLDNDVYTRAIFAVISMIFILRVGCTKLAEN